MSKYLAPITKKRTEHKKMRIMFSLSQKAYEALLELHSQDSELNASQIVSRALIFALEADMMKPLHDRVATAKAQRQVDEPETGDVDQKRWCELFGGTFDGVNCSYNKYEVMVSGQIVKNLRQFPVRMLPKTKDEFRQEVIGGFATLAQAEEAYQRQEAEKNDDVLPEKVVKLAGK